MFETEDINYLEIKILEGQADLILRALELYAFNLHNVYAIDKNSDLEQLRNSLIFHTYETILCKKNSSYKSSYDIIGEYRIEQTRKKRKSYIEYKKFA